MFKLRLPVLTVLLVVPIITSDPARPDEPRQNEASASAGAIHAAQFACDPFPSAKKCGTCHPDHYREWSVSPHAYSQMSPLFNALANKQIRDTSGTLGDFCTRCHAPVRAALREPDELSNLDRHPTSREGVTCVVCHRINQAWGKVSGRQALLAGDIYAPVFGPQGNQNLSAALADTERYGPWRTEPDEDVRGRDVHAVAVPFFQLTTAGFCGSCHDVAVPNGFHLTDTFSEFKHAHASSAGHSCQDCHMGQVPGKPSRCAKAPAAKVGNVFTPPRSRTNHMIVGPSYSILHPGIFPHSSDAVREENARDYETGLATMREWLLFDDEAGWGTRPFEDESPSDSMFPSPWQDAARRYRARSILNEQRALLRKAYDQRLLLLSTGYQLSDILVDRSGSCGLEFHLGISNGTDGHGVPAGAGKPAMLVFLRVAVIDPAGKVIFLSGDLDPNGDVRDEHSLYVRHGVVPRDPFLFSLQTRYLTRNLRGGERQQVLSINYSQDPLPFVRPSTLPTSVLGRPRSVRRHKVNIPTGGNRWARYQIPPTWVAESGVYTIHAQLIVGVVPVNLVHEMSSAGFDYGMSAQEVAQRVVEGHMVLHERTAQVVVAR